MLYAYDTAGEYWERENFFKVFGYTYIHPPKAIKEFYFNPEEFKDIAWIPGVKF